MKASHHPIDTTMRLSTSQRVCTILCTLAAFFSTVSWDADAFVIQILPAKLSSPAEVRGTISFAPLHATSAGSSDDDDLFDYFDPLLSPHAYPNGIGKSPEQRPSDALAQEDEDRYDPLSFPTAKQRRSKQKESRGTVAANDDHPSVDPDFVFDPTLSPHVYANGVPSTIVGDENTVVVQAETRTVGILLMDHGSRNSDSNQRLHELARLYEKNMGSSQVIVRAAHMEIATPTIKEGIQTLVEAGVDEIICHPYFLSPGRHVKEDIPRIVQEAVISLDVDVPVLTTDPVGSNTDIILGAIHSLVQDTSSFLDQIEKRARRS